MGTGTFSRRHAVAKALIMLLVAGLLVGHAAAQTFVQPGETVSITIPVENIDTPEDGDTINNVRVTVESQSGYVTNIAPSAADNVVPGATKNFTAIFVVAGDALNGSSFDVTIKTIIDDVGIDPDPPANDTQVSFNIADPAFIV